MTMTTTRPTSPESPARRLGVLYGFSLCVIACLTLLSQTFVLRELSRQGVEESRIAQAVCDRTLGRSLGVAALEVRIAAGAPDEFRSRVDALRRAVDRSDLAASLEAHLEPSPIFSAAETPRAAATSSARALIDRCTAAGSAPPSEGELTDLARKVVEADDAYQIALADALGEAEALSTAHLNRLGTLVAIVTAFVILALLLEGLCVVNPAVHKIQELLDAMARSHGELATYAARLEQSNKELQDFASVASHDLQEPLRKVQAFSDRFKSKYAAVVDDQGRDYLDRIQSAARRMQTLINDLLTFSRVTTKAQPFVPTDLSASAREVISDLEVRIEQVGGRVELGALPTVDADPLQVRQLLQNLIGNALKYHKPDVPPVVKVWARHVPQPQAGAGPHASDGPAAARGVCEILVEDNGIGFEEVHAERIFTIFQRLHGRTEYEGNGVGLAVCRKIAERHGGTIRASSAPGRGSTFHVTLPFRQPREASCDASSAQP